MPPLGEPLPTIRLHLEPGALVAGRFRVDRLAGLGGMGEVYRAYDNLLQRPVALKRVRCLGVDHAGFQRFHREALALAQLNHPHVCQVYDLLEDPQGTFIAMEWLEGETLDLATHRLDRQVLLVLLLQAAEGLAAAHERDLVHRDLKPHNLMVQGTHLRILDFGLARLGMMPDPEARLADLEPCMPESTLAGLAQDPGMLPTGAYPAQPSDAHYTRQGFFMGSPRYASPEQILGFLAEASSDIFSLGVIAWELLCGAPPFEGEGDPHLHRVVAGEHATPPRQLPRRLRLLLPRMIHRDPERRPTAQEVVTELRRVIHHRRPWTWVGLAAALLLATGSVAFHLKSRGVIHDLAMDHPARVLILPPALMSAGQDLQAEARWVLPEFLAAGLHGSRRLAPLRADELQDLLTRFPEAMSRQPLDPALLQRLCRASGASLVLVSSLADTETRPRMTFRLLDREGRTRTEGEVRTEGPQRGFLQLLPHLAARQLISATAPWDPSPTAAPPIPPEILEAYAHGRAALDRGAYTEAVPLLRQAAERCPHFAVAPVSFGLALRRVGDAQSIPVLQWGRWSARSAGFPRVEIQALIELAMVSRDRGLWSDTARYLDEAMALGRETRDLDMQSSILNNQGLLAMDRNKSAEAERLLREALALQQQLGREADAMLTLSNLAIIAKEAGRTVECVSLNRQVLDHARAFGLQSQEALALNNLGDAALAMGNLAEAEASFRQSLAIRRNSGNRNSLMIPLANLGILARLRHDDGAARSCFEEALALCHETGKAPMEAILLNQMGEWHLQARRLKEAGRAFTQARQLHQRLADATGQAQALAGEAEILFSGGSKGPALTLVRKALALDPDNPWALRTEARCLQAMGQGDQAGASLAHAITAARTRAPEEVPGLESLRRSLLPVS